MRYRSYIAFGIAALGLAACAVSGVVVQNTSLNDPLQRIDSYYGDGVGGRDLSLVVRGDPFAIPNDAFARLVETDLQQSGTMRQPTHPTLAPGPTAKPWYSEVFVFGPSTYLHGNDVCAKAPAVAASVPTPGSVEVIAGFCISGRELTEITGHATVAGPDDPRFQALLNQVQLALFRPDSVTPIGPPPGPNGNYAP